MNLKNSVSKEAMSLWRQVPHQGESVLRDKLFRSWQTFFDEDIQVIYCTYLVLKMQMTRILIRLH
jgi:hypothetical protein